MLRQGVTPVTGPHLNEIHEGSSNTSVNIELESEA